MHFAIPNNLSSETFSFKTTWTINPSACCSPKAYYWKHKRYHETPHSTASSTGDPKLYTYSKPMGNTRTGRTSQKIPCSSAECCYFPSSAPEHNPVHCKHLALLKFCFSAHGQATHHLHSLQGKTAIPTPIWPMDTNSCGGLPSGRRERTRDLLNTTKHTNTSALEEWEPRKRPSPGLMWNSQLPAGRLCCGIARCLHQVQMDVSHVPSHLPVGREKGCLTNGNKEVAIGSHSRSTKVVREMKFIWRA